MFTSKYKDKVDELHYLGYTKVGILGGEHFSRFYEETMDLVSEARKAHPSGELISLINSTHYLKLKSNEIVGRYLNPFLREIFSEQETDIYPVSHILKPFGIKGSICHQDSTIVNEPENFSLNAWIPFTATNYLNGCMWMLPGSHTFPHYYRPFIPNPFFEKPVTKLIWKKMTPVLCKAGEVLVFHRSMIHGSSGNYLLRTRIAAESVVIPKNAPFVQYRYDSTISDDKIVRYVVPFEHFMRPVPKEDFYNKVYPYELYECDTEEQIVNKLYSSFPDFEKHAGKLKK